MHLLQSHLAHTEYQGSDGAGTTRNAVPVPFFSTGTAFRFMLMTSRNDSSVCIFTDCVTKGYLSDLCIIDSRRVLEHFKNRKLICYKGSVNVQSSDIATIEPIFISQFGCEATLTTRAELGV
jgi:hypothetical protein